MDWITPLAVIAGITASVLAIMYRRWWKDALAQLDVSRRATRRLQRRVAALTVAQAAGPLFGVLDSPDGPGGARPDPGEGA